MTKQMMMLVGTLLVMFWASEAFAEEKTAIAGEAVVDDGGDGPRVGVGLASRSLDFSGVSALVPIEWSRLRLEPTFDVSWSQWSYPVPYLGEAGEMGTEQVEQSRLNLGLGTGLHYKVARTDHFHAYFGGESMGWVARQHMEQPESLEGLGGLASATDADEGTTAGVRIGPLFGFEARAWDRLSLAAEGAVLASMTLYDETEGSTSPLSSVQLAGAFKLRYLF